MTLMLLVASFTLRNQSGYRRARKGTVFFAVDASDAPSQGSRKETYDPCFAKRNAIPDQIK